MALFKKRSTRKVAAKKVVEPVVEVVEEVKTVTRPVKSEVVISPYSIVAQKGGWFVYYEGRLVYRNVSEANAEKFVKARHNA
jgi:hypothetical protein